MNRRWGGLLAATALLGLCRASWATDYTNEVLQIGVGARPLGMGGAFVALADDSSAVYWNPAGLTAVKHMDVQAVQEGRQYDNLNLNDVGSRYTFVSGAMTVPRMGSFGMGFMRFGVQDIPYVPDQTLNGTAPIVGNSFQTQDFAVMGAWGNQFYPGIRAGLGVKWLTGGTIGLSSASNGALQDAGYNYYGADLGLMADIGHFTSTLEGLSFGVNFQDILNSGVAWHGTPTNPVETVDINPKTGLAYTPPLGFLKDSDSKWTILADVDPKYSPDTLFHYGTEFWYKDTLALRGGVRVFAGGLQSDEYSMGASVRIFFLQVDYAYINYELTPMQYLSLGATF